MSTDLDGRVEKSFAKEPQRDTLGHRIWQLRCQRRYPANVLSKAAGLAHTQISRIEREPEAVFDPISVFLLAEIFEPEDPVKLAKLAMWLICGGTDPDHPRMPGNNPRTNLRGGALKKRDRLEDFAGQAKIARKRLQQIDEEQGRLRGTTRTRTRPAKAAEALAVPAEALSEPVTPEHGGDTIPRAVTG